MRIEDIHKLNEFSGGKINVYSKDRIQSVVQDEMCRTILTTCGIAKSVSPYINFLEEEKGGFESVSDFMKRHAMDGDMTSENEIFKKAYILGFHDNNYIALDHDGRVIYIDYERLSASYINKDLESFLSILSKFNIIIADYFEENPDGDFFEEGFTDEVVDAFVDYIMSIDDRAINNDAFWDLLIDECRE